MTDQLNVSQLQWQEKLLHSLLESLRDVSQRNSKSLHRSERMLKVQRVRVAVNATKLHNLKIHEYTIIYNSKRPNTTKRTFCIG